MKEKLTILSRMDTLPCDISLKKLVIIEYLKVIKLSSQKLIKVGKLHDEVICVNVIIIT